MNAFDTQLLHCAVALLCNAGVLLGAALHVWWRDFGTRPQVGVRASWPALQAPVSRCAAS